MVETVVITKEGEKLTCPVVIIVGTFHVVIIVGTFLGRGYTPHVHDAELASHASQNSKRGKQKSETSTDYF